MKISLNWIRDYVPLTASVEEISRAVTFLGFEVESVHTTGAPKLEHVVVGGIVTNGGVASTVREAHVRDFEITVLSDGCAAFSRELHNVSIDALKPVARIATVAEILSECEGA